MPAKTLFLIFGGLSSYAMIKRLYILSGISIVAVICNHSAWWGKIAMFGWTYRYLPGSLSPNYDQIGSPSYYLLIALSQLPVFCVPAFLFITGFFLAYMTRGKESYLTWKVVLRRSMYLLIPYLIWSLIWFAYDYSIGNIYTLPEYLKRLFLGAANPTYFYVIVLLQLYLLSPILVPMVRNRRKTMILGTAVLLSLTMLLRYQNYFIAPITNNLHYTFSEWFITKWLLFFVLGIYAGLYQLEFSSTINKYKWILLVTAVVFGILSIFEADLGFRNLRMDWLGPATITSSIYVISLILCFLAFKDTKVPFSNFFSRIGNNIYGLYLTHWIVLSVVIKFIYDRVPMILADPVVLQSILIILAIFIPILVISLASKTSAHQISRYIFG